MELVNNKLGKNVLICHKQHHHHHHHHHYQPQHAILPEVHIEGEVHEKLIDFLHRENIKRNFDIDRLSSILWTDSSVVTNLRQLWKINIFKK